VWNGAWHIRHAVKNSVVDLIGWLGVSGWLGIFKATALVDGDVNKDRSRLHLFYQGIGH
jgi:hypothetical protein